MKKYRHNKRQIFSQDSFSNAIVVEVSNSVLVEHRFKSLKLLEKIKVLYSINEFNTQKRTKITGTIQALRYDTANIVISGTNLDNIEIGTIVFIRSIRHDNGKSIPAKVILKGKLNDLIDKEEQLAITSEKFKKLNRIKKVDSKIVLSIISERHFKNSDDTDGTGPDKQ